MEIAKEDQRGIATAGKERFNSKLRLLLAAATSTSPRLMNNVSINELDEFVVVYLEDVLVYFNSSDGHLLQLTSVLERLHDRQLYVGINS